MKTPLVNINIPSIYPENSPNKVPLPAKLARCTPDMKRALHNVAADLAAAGGKLRLSDLFRSYDMQLASHMDYVSKRKKAFSPPPGGSLHEAGRAIDLDLGAIRVGLAKFWDIARPHGLVPIIDAPVSGVSESWHFECRGSHQLVYAYYKAGKGGNFPKPYQAMAASAIVSIGVRVDKFGAGQDMAYIQSALVRLGQTIGNIDGAIGPRTRDGLAALGVTAPDAEGMIAALDRLLQQRFPDEFFDQVAEVPLVPA